MPLSDQEAGSLNVNLTEEKLDSTTVHQGLFFNVYRDTVLLPDKKTSLREYIRHPGAVVILPVLDNGKLLLEQQFRYPLNQVFLEFPAGKIDKGETPLSCAKRELMEETGYTASNWQFVCTVHNAVGYSDEALYIYLAKGLKSGEKHPDAEEFIETFSVSLQQLLEWVKSGKITDAKTIIGTFWLEKINKKEWDLSNSI